MSEVLHSTLKSHRQIITLILKQTIDLLINQYSNHLRLPPRYCTDMQYHTVPSYCIVTKYCTILRYCIIKQYYSILRYCKVMQYCIFRRNAQYSVPKNQQQPITLTSCALFYYFAFKFYTVKFLKIQIQMNFVLILIIC